MTTLTIPCANMKSFSSFWSLFNARTDNISRISIMTDAESIYDRPSAENDARQKVVESVAPWNVCTALYKYQEQIICLSTDKSRDHRASGLMLTEMPQFRHFHFSLRADKVVPKREDSPLRGLDKLTNLRCFDHADHLS